MQDHPLTMMAGALGVGVLLGIASEGVGTRNGSNGSRSSQYTNGSSSGDSAMSGILASLIGPAAGTAREELEQLVREGFSTLRSSMREQTKPEVANRDVGVQ
jgi:hypothetical protein